MIKYVCSHCDAKLETDDELGTKTEACPLCGAANSVPPSKAQKAAIKQQQRKAAREHAEEQRRRESEAQAERLRQERERQLAIQRQYDAAVAEAKADPGKQKIWYCRITGGAEHGPMQETILQKWVDGGRIGPQDRVRTDVNPVWVCLRDIPERFPTPLAQPASDSTELRCPKCGEKVRVPSQETIERKLREKEQQAHAGVADVAAPRREMAVQTVPPEPPREAVAAPASKSTSKDKATGQGAVKSKGQRSPTPAPPKKSAPKPVPRPAPQAPPSCR